MMPSDANARTVAFASEQALLAWAREERGRALALAGFACRLWGRLQTERTPDAELLERAREAMQALAQAGLCVLPIGG